MGRRDAGPGHPRRSLPLVALPGSAAERRPLPSPMPARAEAAHPIQARAASWRSREANRLVAIQRIFVDPATARYTDKATLGALGTGAWRGGGLGPTIGLAEGFETARAWSIIHGLPCWASLGSRRLDLVAIPAERDDPDPCRRQRPRRATRGGAQHGGLRIRAPARRGRTTRSATRTGRRPWRRKGGEGEEAGDLPDWQATQETSMPTLLDRKTPCGHGRRALDRAPPRRHRADRAPRPERGDDRGDRRLRRRRRLDAARQLRDAGERSRAPPRDAPLPAHRARRRRARERADGAPADPDGAQRDAGRAAAVLDPRRHRRDRRAHGGDRPARHRAGAERRERATGGPGAALRVPSAQRAGREAPGPAGDGVSRRDDHRTRRRGPGKHARRPAAANGRPDEPAVRAQRRARRRRPCRTCGTSRRRSAASPRAGGSWR